MLRLLNLRSALSPLKTLTTPTPTDRYPNPIRFVSGTAKGKAKLKSGQPLKRQSPLKRKGGATSSSGTPRGGRGSQTQQLTQLVDSCLNAPTATRHLSPKQRQRELQREQLGLISKDRQRELDLLKKPQPEDDVTIGTPGLDLIKLGLVDAEKIPKYELTVEDGRKLAKEYSRVLMRQHRARRAAESGLLRMKKEAIEALPDGLREKAMVPDLTPFPAERYMATLTPPIEGYIDKVREAARKFAGKEKLR